MIVYLWAETSCSPRRGRSRRNFPWTISETWLSWEEHLFSLLLSSVRKKTNNLQPRICGRSAVWWWAMLSERENHFSSRLACNLSFLSSFHCVFLSHLFCQSVCGLFYFIFSPNPWYFDFGSNFVVLFFSLLSQGKANTGVFSKVPLLNVLYKILSFEQEVEWCHSQGRVVLCDSSAHLLKLYFWMLWLRREPRCCARHAMFQRPASREWKNTHLHWHRMATRAGPLYIKYFSNDFSWRL